MAERDSSSKKEPALPGHSSGASSFSPLTKWTWLLQVRLLTFPVPGGPAARHPVHPSVGMFEAGSAATPGFFNMSADYPDGKNAGLGLSGKQVEWSLSLTLLVNDIWSK